MSSDRRTLVRAFAGGAMATALAAPDAMALSRGSSASGSQPGFAEQKVETRFLDFPDPVEMFEAHFRFERDLVRDQGTTLTWYFWLAYIVPEDGRPQPLLRFEGMEFSYFRRVAEHTYRIHAHNLSYARDLRTNAYTDSVLNPLTGETVTVVNTVLLNDPGTVHSPLGFRNMNGDGSYVVPYRQFRLENDLVKFDSVRTAPPNWPAMHMESSTQWADYRSFKDRSITSLPTRSTTVYLFPYPAWLKMGDRKGHMLGYVDARKIGGPSKLPAEFLARTQREYPELLSPRWDQFEKRPSFAY